MADLTIYGGGTVFLLSANTDAGREWIAEHISSEPWQQFGPAIAVEHRYIENIVAGAQSDGLTVE
jgi:hypothetical protein